MNLSSRLPSGERVELVNAEQFSDFQVFQKELATVGTNSFANGQAATEIRPPQVFGNLVKSYDTQSPAQTTIDRARRLWTDHEKIPDPQIRKSRESHTSLV